MTIMINALEIFNFPKREPRGGASQTIFVSTTLDEQSGEDIHTELYDFFLVSQSVRRDLRSTTPDQFLNVLEILIYILSKEKTKNRCGILNVLFQIKNTPFQPNILPPKLSNFFLFFTNFHGFKFSSKYSLKCIKAKK